jgi:digeranylgeranylglycerophospholipid reductase
MAGPRVAVIGGGPAGLAAALEGSRLGLKVDLFEKRKIGENIRCAEGFIDSLCLLGKPEAGVRFKVKEAILKVKREFRVNCESINLWMIDRKEWQCYLAEKARSAGVRIYENCRITPEHLKQLQKEYDWVIDASGVPSVTSLAFGFRDYYRRHGAVTAQYVVEGNFSYLKDKLKFVLLPNYLGYCWVFPKGRDQLGRETANVGIGWFQGGGPGKSIWKELDRFVEQEGITGEILRKFGGIVPIRLRQNLQFDNILLVGDAAGCASPMHGGGIDVAFITGQLAARWIAASQEERGDFSREVWQLLGPKLEVEERLCKLWMKAGFDFLDGLASFVTRDYRQITPWFILRNFPTLISELRAGMRFWSGLTRGDWRRGSFRDLLSP